jgi:hypothetical protein
MGLAVLVEVHVPPNRGALKLRTPPSASTTAT